MGLLGAGIAGGGGGCADKPPPPQDVPVPLGPGEGAVRTEDRGKPMPGPDVDAYSPADLPPPPFNDVPLVYQETPEQQVFVDAYNRVGRPRLVVFVNRTLQGELIRVDDAGAGVSVDGRQPGRND